jgi:imidazolonepropionase-like amidohydrolase
MPQVSFAIRNVTLIDGTGANPLPRATVLIARERIVAVGPGTRVDVPDGVETLDGTGRWLMPGLVDLHVHVNNCGPEAFPLWLANGVTSIRDIGGDIATLIPWRAELAAGRVSSSESGFLRRTAESAPTMDSGLKTQDSGRIGPRLFTHGPMIDGAPSPFGRMPGGAFGQMWTDVDGPGSAIAEAERLLAAGVDGLKLYQMLPPDAATAIIRHVDGRVPITGHLTATRASEAIIAGINHLEHNFVTPYNDVCRPEDRTAPGAGWQTPGFIAGIHAGWSHADFDAPHARAFIELMAESRVYFNPTMTWGTNALALEESEDEQGERYLPPVMRRRREEQERRVRDLAERGQTPPQPEPSLLHASAEQQLAFVSRLIEAGVLVMAGTDTGALAGIPGFTLHRELRWLARAGMAPMTIIERATRIAAEALRRADDQGTVRPGRRADLLLLDADPLADIRNLRRINRVVKDGRVYDPAVLLG